MIKFGYENERVTVCELSATYTQNADDSVRSDDCQLLELTYTSPGAGGYFVLKSERWAFDSIEELTAILKDFAAKFEEGK